MFAHQQRATIPFGFHQMILVNYGLAPMINLLTKKKLLITTGTPGYESGINI
jgi:hypothetical protein